MAGHSPHDPHRDNRSADEPLISARFIYRLTAVVALVVIATIAINLAGRWLGQRIALAGHSDSDEIHLVSIGKDQLRLAANSIRFREQRRNGVAEHVDLYLTWPELEGYSEELKQRFNDLAQSSSLVFLGLGERTMSLDMSGRLRPIYARLVAGAPKPAGHGLTMYRMRADSGYGGELLLTARRNGEPDYVVRCLAGGDDANPIPSGECQRDMHLGKSLSLTYRFSSLLLEDWRALDTAMRDYVESRLESAGSATLPD